MCDAPVAPGDEAPFVIENFPERLPLKRELFAVKREVLRQLAEGVATPEDLDRSWMHDFGMDIGPCGIMDAVGLDVVADIEQAYADHAGDPGGAPPPFLRRMVAEGRLGVKSGEGFYRYPAPAFARPGFLDGEPS